MLAVDLRGARGDLDGGGAVRWTRDSDTPYVSSPLLFRGKLYFFKHVQSFLTSADAATGRTLFTERVGLGNVFASRSKRSANGAGPLVATRGDLHIGQGHRRWRTTAKVSDARRYQFPNASIQVSRHATGRIPIRDIRRSNRFARRVAHRTP
jgi:outer membrane protein assembly factor BamB